MPKCRSCNEVVSKDATFCPACGADLSEKVGSRPVRHLNRAIPIVAGVVILVALVTVSALTIFRKKPQPTRPPVAARSANRIGDSAQTLSDTLTRQVAPETTAVKPASPAKYAAVSREYLKKVDDLLQKANRTQSRLSSAARLKPDQAVLLGQIRNELNGVRGGAEALASMGDRDALEAARAKLDSKLEEIRKMFAKVGP